MFCRRQTNPSKNHLYEGALWTVYKDEIYPFNVVLPKDSSGTIHQRNIDIRCRVI